MESATIKKLIKVSQNHRDGKWFIPCVAALLDIDGSGKYNTNNDDEFVAQVDKQIYNRFLGVFNNIEEWVDYSIIQPLRDKEEVLNTILDCVDKLKLYKKHSHKIAYKQIDNYIYVFKI